MFIILRMGKYEVFVTKLESKRHQILDELLDAAGSAKYDYKAESTRVKIKEPSYFLYAIQLEAMKTFAEATKLWYVLCELYS